MEIDLKSVFEIACAVGAQLAGVFILIRGLKHDAHIAAQSAAKLKALEAAVLKLDASLGRVWRVLEDGVSPRARPGKVIAYEDTAPVAVTTRTLVEDWDDGPTGAAEAS